MGLGGSLIGWHSTALPTSDSIKVYEKIKIALGFIALDRTKGTGEENKVTFSTSFFIFLFLLLVFNSLPTPYEPCFSLIKQGRKDLCERRRYPFCCVRAVSGPPLLALSLPFPLTGR